MDNSQKIADRRSYVAMEYQTLRDEVLRRVDIRHQIISITLSLAGALLGFGLNNPDIALIYPVIAAFLAAGWAQNDIRIRQLGKYIREELEEQLMGAGWESYLLRRGAETRTGGLPLVVLSPSGTFIFTQVIAIVVGFSRFSGTLIEWLLLGLSCVSVIYTSLLSEKVRRELKS